MVILAIFLFLKKLMKSIVTLKILGEITHAHVCVYVCACICACISMRVCACVCTSCVCACIMCVGGVCVCVCICVCVCVRACVCSCRCVGVRAGQLLKLTTIMIVQERIMTVNTITIVLTVIESSVRRLVTAMCINYATSSLQCTRKYYFSFQVTSELQKPKYWPQCLHAL